MYMYYLLGYKLLGKRDTDKAFTEDSEMDSRVSKARNRKKARSKKDNLSRPIKALFNRMDNEQYEKVSLLFRYIVMYILISHARIFRIHAKSCSQSKMLSRIELLVVADSLISSNYPKNNLILHFG